MFKIINKLIVGYKLTKHGNDYCFIQTNRFVNENGYYPIYTELTPTTNQDIISKFLNIEEDSQQKYKDMRHC